MITHIRNWFRERGHVVVMTLLVMYLAALALKTGQVAYRYYQQEKTARVEPPSTGHP